MVGDSVEPSICSAQRKRTEVAPDFIQIASSRVRNRVMIHAADASEIPITVPGVELGVEEVDPLPSCPRSFGPQHLMVALANRAQPIDRWRSIEVAVDTPTTFAISLRVTMVAYDARPTGHCQRPCPIWTISVDVGLVASP